VLLWVVRYFIPAKVNDDGSGILRCTTDDQGIVFGDMTIDLLDRQLFPLFLPHCCRSSPKFDGQR
jgi:hypothetical protein